MKTRTYGVIAFAWILLTFWLMQQLLNPPLVLWVDMANKTGDRSGVVQVWQQKWVDTKRSENFPRRWTMTTDRCQNAPHHSPTNQMSV